MKIKPKSAKVFSYLYSHHAKFLSWQNMNKFDAIVVGIGGMGSAALFELSKSGKKVLGIEQFGLAHDLGSSHGASRIIRLAYSEHPSYVPLVQRAYKLWQNLEDLSGEKILHVTGSIHIGFKDSKIFIGSKESCEFHDLRHEILNGKEISKRFPAFKLPQDILSVFQPDGGFLNPEKSIESFVKLASSFGAELHYHEKLLDWNPTTEGGVRIRTNLGEYEADNLIFTTGAWTGKILPSFQNKLIPERQVMGWFDTKKSSMFLPEQFPVWTMLVPEGRFYGFPEFQSPGFKIGLYHHLFENVDPDELDHSLITEKDEQVLRNCVSEYFPDANNQMIHGKVCMFTNTPDEDFIVDRIPEFPQIIIAAGFSGHGFKFCSVIGEIIASLVTESEIDLDIEMFRVSRF